MRVKVSKYQVVWVEGKRVRKKVDTGEAEFCAWGVNCEEYDHGAGTFSTAIIKRDDGTVENVPCEWIQFIKE
jgi:hypothetical protein